MSESLLIWSAAATLVCLVVLPYVLVLRRRGHQERERLDEARRLGMDRPQGQFPFIDPEICIGCGGCVKACPEGDVLGLVGGLATVVNGMRCIGIGQCAAACPVGGVEIRLGALKGRADVPQLDAHYETNVPGIFIAGELGGLALIRNAARQGRDAVRRIAETLEKPPSRPDVLDLAIVGAGPSGLSAALAAVECGLSYVVLEQEQALGGTIFQYPRRKLTHTQPVELPLYGELRRAEYSKEELLDLFEGLVDEHGLELRLGQRVCAIDRHERHFSVRTSHDEHHARKVILALGRRGTPRKLGVPGEELPKVMYQVRDAAQYRGRRVLCVGGGDSAVEAAIGLARQPGNDVTLSYRKEQLFRIKKKNHEQIEALAKRRRIRLILPSQVREITPSTVCLDSRGDALEIGNDFVFVLIGGTPPFQLLRDTGIRFGDEAPVGDRPPDPPPPPDPYTDGLTRAHDA